MVELARDKFAELDREGTGYLGEDALHELMEWMLHVYSPLGNALDLEEQRDVLDKTSTLIRASGDSRLVSSLRLVSCSGLPNNYC